MKDKKLTVIGDVDPVDIVSKLRKLCYTEILTVGPAKEEKKDDKKKDEGKKEEGGKKEDDKKKENQQLKELSEAAYRAYYYNLHHYPTTYNPHYRVVPEENPNSCTIC